MGEKTKGAGVALAEFEGYVGAFDSGVGGTSVLRELVRELPHESFVYFGDSANAPYGEKTTEQVCDLSRAIAERLLGAGCKALVIACNTATSAAAEALREAYPHVPIVGVEPALKPAVLASHHGRVLVMATPLTARLEKFQHLLAEWGSEAEVEVVPCPGLAGRIEQGNLDAPDLRELIHSLIGAYANEVDAVVLGCTHYPYVANHIRAVVGDVPFFDPAPGAARQLRRLLASAGMLCPTGAPGRVRFLSSKDTPEELALYQRLFEGEE